MIHLCTYFDRHYLVRALALYQSLRAHCAPFTLWVLCLDHDTEIALENLRLPEVRPVTLAELEEGDMELARARPNRSLIEYYFTCSPSWPLYLFDHEPGIHVVTYVDADYLFYSSLRPVLEEFGQRSVGIIPHDFPSAKLELEKYGRFNVGLVVMRNDAAARSCLTWWRERCIEWCYDRVEPGRYNDQKYLDAFPDVCENLAVIQHRGARLAPWNWMNYELRRDGEGATVDGQPLIAYHFHGLRLYGHGLYDVRLSRYGRMPPDLRRWLYDGYIDALHAAEAWAGEALPETARRGAPIRGGHSLTRIALAAARRDLAVHRRSARR